MSRAVCAAVTGILLGAAEANDGTALTAGTESIVTLPSSSGSVMKVYLPSNYDTGQKWPALFFYHGMGGSPDTTLMRRFTDGRDYIVVGMSYAASDDDPRTGQEQGAGMQRERAAFHAALAWLIAHASVDETRLFMAGASKGGWTAGSLGELELPRLGGLIILLAGRLSGHGLDAAALRNKPIYIGAGEDDPNLIPARSAREFYKRNGAVVSFEEYAGHGHAIPPDALRLRAWLQVHGRCRQKAFDPASRAEATAELNGIFNAVMAETNALAQYNLLLGLADDPRLRLCDPAVLKQVRTQFTSLTQASPAKEEWRAESMFNDLLYRESCIQRLADMKSVFDGFQNLVQSYPQTRCGRLAAQHLPRLADAYEKSVEVTRGANEGHARGPAKTVQPSFPVNEVSRDAFPVPVRKGNKITFEQPRDK